MIKVLMIGNHPSNKGGMTNVISQIRDHNWENENIHLSFIPTFIPKGLIWKTLFFAGSVLRILVIFFINKPDIVHMHMSYKGSFTRKYCIHQLCKLFHVKDIVHLHGSEFKKWYDEVNDVKKSKIRRFLSECNCVVVLGQKWENTIREIENSARIIVINNAVDIPADIARWDKNRCRILFLGVLIPRKGVSDLIKAVSVLRDRGKADKLQLIIAGTGEEEHKLKQLVNDKKLVEYITFCGWVSGEKKYDLLKESQIFALPSYNEGLPVSLLEAASYGLPIIATEVGDIPSVVTDGINGMLIKPGDVEALADGIISMANEESFEKMSCNSRKIAINSFSSDSFFSKLSEVYMLLAKENE